MASPSCTILDEPTGVLTPQEADHLFRILAGLSAEGVPVILITHKLREIMAITDNVSVMRLGEIVADLKTAETDQEQLAELEVSGSSGGGMVQVTMSGKGELRGVKIDPALANPDDVEVLEDLIMAAANDAKSKVEVRVQEEMQKLTGGLELPPGMQLPF